MFYNREAVRGWRVVAVPARGHVSNVSAVVLPARGDVPDDAQMPMFSADELAELRQTAHDIKEAARLQLRILQEERRARERRFDATIGSLRGRTIGSLRARRRSARQESFVPYGGWEAFVQHFQQLQRDLRKDVGEKIFKYQIAALEGCDVKTLTRWMEGFGLSAKQWPPMAWDPNEDRPWRPPWG
jgi:hypothetical protein